MVAERLSSASDTTRPPGGWLGEFKTQARLGPELQPHDGRTVSVPAALPGPGRRQGTATDSGEQAGVDALGEGCRDDPWGPWHLMGAPLISAHIPSHLPLPAGPLSSPECPASTLPTPHSSLCTSGLRTSSRVPKPVLKGRQHVLSYICLECRASKWNVMDRGDVGAFPILNKQDRLQPPSVLGGVRLWEVAKPLLCWTPSPAPLALAPWRSQIKTQSHGRSQQKGASSVDTRLVMKEGSPGMAEPALAYFWGRAPPPLQPPQTSHCLRIPSAQGALRSADPQGQLSLAVTLSPDRESLSSALRKMGPLVAAEPAPLLPGL